MTCTLSVDTDVIILLLYWVNQADMQCKVQMERWDGQVLDSNATYSEFGQICLQLPGVIVIQLPTILGKEMPLH